MLYTSVILKKLCFYDFKHHSDMTQSFCISFFLALGHPVSFFLIKPFWYSSSIAGASKSDRLKTDSVLTSWQIWMVAKAALWYNFDRLHHYLSGQTDGTRDFQAILISILFYALNRDGYLYRFSDSVYMKTDTDTNSQTQSLSRPILIP